MNHSSPLHTQQLLFLTRSSETRIDDISIAKGKTPVRHTYLFTVQDEQMDQEGKEEKGEKKAVSILIRNKQRNLNKHEKLAIEQKLLNANNILETENGNLLRHLALDGCEPAMKTKGKKRFTIIHAGGDFLGFKNKARFL